jgi:hypothetical protein
MHMLAAKIANGLSGVFCYLINLVPGLIAGIMGNRVLKNSHTNENESLSGVNRRGFRFFI